MNYAFETYSSPTGPVPVNCSFGVEVAELGRSQMEFAFLTYPEAEGAVIRWDNSVPKPPELVAAALAAGFSGSEIWASPVGLLEHDFGVGGGWEFKAGARALIGTNGSTLIELP